MPRRGQPLEELDALWLLLAELDAWLELVLPPELLLAPVLLLPLLLPVPLPTQYPMLAPFGLTDWQLPLGHSLSFEQIWKLAEPVHAVGATQCDPVNLSAYSYGPSVPPSAAQPGCAACMSRVPSPQQIVPAIDAQSGVPSQVQSVSPVPQAVPVGVQAAVPDAGSQQCSVGGVQYWALPPSVVSL